MTNLRILVDGRWTGPHGIGRFFREVVRRFPRSWRVIYELGGKPLTPLDPLRLSAAVRRDRPHVFFSPGISAPLWSSVPLVLTVHDLIHIRFPGERTLPKILYYEFILRRSVERAFRILTVSEFSRRQILEWANVREESVIVVKNGVGSEFTPNGHRMNPGFPYILYVGNHKPHKNLPRLLEAFAELCRENRGLRLCMTGNPGPILMEHIRRLSLERRVVFLGTLSEAELASWYRGAELLAFPSLYEGFGLPVLEAMASGVPVVTSNVTALPEVAGPAAVLVDPYDVASIAEGMRAVLDDTELRRKLRESGLRRAKAFTWEDTARKVIEVLAAAAAAT